MTAADATVEAVATTDTLLVALDFDGTLSPLVDEPMSARMTPGARAAVDALAMLPRTVVALVSGRSLGHLREISEHDDSSPIWLAGSHGAQFWIPGAGAQAAGDDETDIALRDRLQKEVTDRTADMQGVWIEPKEYGLGVHTRTADADTADAARSLVDQLLAARRRRGVDAPDTTSSSSRSDTRARIPPWHGCASASGRRPCSSPATTSPMKML